jgi:hypothetical protein
MGLMDNMKDKMSDMDSMRARFEDLKQKEQMGDLDDKGREELNKLKQHFDK